MKEEPIKNFKELLAEEYEIADSLAESPRKEKSGKCVIKKNNQPQNNRGMGLYVSKNWDEIGLDDIASILDTTIKEDWANKLILFLAELLTYTDEDQINIMFNAPSSSGKSYLALETASLFPEEDLIKVAYASPTAFWYSYSEYDEERDCKIVDLERKLIIFLDMPYFELLEKIRSLLSKDEKEISVRVTNRNKSGSNKADHIIVRGFPTVVFASASFRLDEQELTRFIMLSPETSKEKVEASLEEAALRVSDADKYKSRVSSNKKREELKNRIVDIRNSYIKTIIVRDHIKLLNLFKGRYSKTKARHARDIKRVAGLAKALALINLWTREREDGVVYVNDLDIENAFKLWDRIYLPQELGLAPYIYNVYKEVIYPLFIEKGIGVERGEIQKKYVEVYNNQLPDWKLTKEWLPMLNASGITYEENDSNDRRKVLIYCVLDPNKEDHIQPHSPIVSNLNNRSVNQNISVNLPVESDSWKEI